MRPYSLLFGPINRKFVCVLDIAGPQVVMRTLPRTEGLHLEHGGLQEMFVAAREGAGVLCAQGGDHSDVVEEVVLEADVGPVAPVLLALRRLARVPLHHQVVGWPPRLVLDEVVGEGVQVFAVHEDAVHAVRGADRQPVWVVSGGLGQQILHGEET